VSLTSKQLVDRYARSTGLPPRQVLMLVARCALVRRLAEQHFDRFILKGGALLYHVYGTTRVSFVDTDYAEIETRGAPDPVEVERQIVFNDAEQGCRLRTTPEGQWTERGNLVKGNNLTFSLERFREGRDTRSQVNISVSFRRSERLEEPDEELFFDPDGCSPTGSHSRSAASR
jgi:hypothetical protein